MNLIACTSRKTCVQFYSKVSWPSIASLDSWLDLRSRMSYQETSHGSSLARQKTKDSPMTDFLIILHRHTTVTQHDIVYSRKRLYAQSKTSSSYKVNVSSRISVSSFISSSTASNICSKCKQTVYTCVWARREMTACLFCNVKWFWAYLATQHDKDQL